MWLCLGLARPVVVQKGASLAAFGQLAIAELMSYLNEHGLQTPQATAVSRIPASDLVRRWKWALVCNQDGMQTGEIILLLGVIGTIAGATAAGYGRSRRIPEPIGAEPERGEPERVEYSGSAAPDVNEVLRRTLQ